MPPYEDGSAAPSLHHQEETGGEATFLTVLWMNDQETGSTLWPTMDAPSVFIHVQDSMPTVEDLHAGHYEARSTATSSQPNNCFQEDTVGSYFSSPSLLSTHATKIPQTAPRIASEKPDLQDVRRCAVCGDAQAGVFYGSLSCQSCKSFFLRFLRKTEESFSCRKMNNCPITVETRTFCRACRLRKCLVSGMRLPEQEVLMQKQRKRRRELGDDQNPWKRAPALEISGFTKYPESCKNFHLLEESPVEGSSGEPRSQPLSTPPERIPVRVDANEPELPATKVASMRHLKEMYGNWLERFREWSRNIPMHQDFNESDQSILVHETARERFILGLSHRLQGKRDIEFHEQICEPPTESSIASLFPALRFVLVRVNDVEPTEEEYKMLDMMLYLKKSFNGLQNTEKLGCYIEDYNANLKQQVMNIESSHNGRFARLLTVLESVLVASAELENIIRMHETNSSAYSR